MGRSKNRKGTRDAMQSLHVPSVRSLLNIPSVNTALGLQDFRLLPEMPWETAARTIRNDIASVTAVTVPKRSKKGRFNSQIALAFKAPAETLVCVRRHRRKAVLFAKRKAGRSGQRKPRNTRFRGVKC